MRKKVKVSIEKVARTSVAQWKKLMLQVIFLPFGYVRDLLANAFLLWHKYRAVILNLPTGTGKTTFVIECIIKYAIKNNLRVLIVSNRISLDAAIKKLISNMLKLYTDYPDELLRQMDDYGLITITTYQKLPLYLKNKEFCKGIAYAVFDEAHYFTSDAIFSEMSAWVLTQIPVRFSAAIRIYMSATIDEVLPYICQAECHSNAVTRWHTRFHTDRVYRERLMHSKDWRFRNLYPEIMQMLADDAVYAPYYPTPMVYKMKADYSHMRLKFYSDSRIIKDMIDSTDDKSIVFVAGKKFGAELNTELSDSAYMNAELNVKNPELLNRIIATESFDEKTLITTSVFCNGCNIRDTDVKHIFIECLDKTDILQMAGRKRKTAEDDTYTLYLRIPEIDTLKKYIQRAERMLNVISLGQNDNDAFINMSFENHYDVSEAQKIVYSYENKLHFNQIAIDMLNNQVVYYENLIDLLETKGPEGYCKMIAKELFQKRFTRDMLAESRDYYAETISWLETYTNQILDKEALARFGNELILRIRLFNHDLKERSDRTLGIRALNKRLASNNLPFEIVQDEQAEHYSIKSTDQPLVNGEF